MQSSNVFFLFTQPKIPSRFDISYAPITPPITPGLSSISIACLLLSSPRREKEKEEKENDEKKGRMRNEKKGEQKEKDKREKKADEDKKDEKN